MEHTLDEYFFDVLRPDLAAVLQELVVFAGGGEILCLGEGLHAAVGGGGGEAGGVGGGEGVLAAAVGGSDFSPHGGNWNRTQRGAKD